MAYRLAVSHMGADDVFKKGADKSSKKNETDSAILVDIKEVNNTKV